MVRNQTLLWHKSYEEDEDLVEADKRKKIYMRRAKVFLYYTRPIKAFVGGWVYKEKSINDEVNNKEKLMHKLELDLLIRGFFFYYG